MLTLYSKVYNQNAVIEVVNLKCLVYTSGILYTQKKSQRKKIKKEKKERKKNS